MEKSHLVFLNIQGTNARKKIWRETQLVNSKEEDRWDLLWLRTDTLKPVCVRHFSIEEKKEENKEEKEN